MKEKSFTLYSEQYDVIADLPLKEKGRLLDGVFTYLRSGLEPDFREAPLRMAFRMFKSRNLKPETKRDKAFVKPTVEEVAEYVKEKGYTFRAENFCDFYESKGWMIGKSKMKDWRAACRTWGRTERRPVDTHTPNGGDPKFKSMNIW